MPKNSLPPADSALPDDLQAIAQAVTAASLRRRGDSLALLALLRLLEQLHGDIRDTLFSEALPDNRQRLYALLRDIEVNGGWPYIQRMRLLALLERYSGDIEALFPPDSAAPDPGSTPDS